MDAISNENGDCESWLVRRKAKKIAEQKEAEDGRQRRDEAKM